MSTFLDERERTIDLAQIERAVREILDALGEDPDRYPLTETPGRVARMYAELLSGVNTDPAEYLRVQFQEGAEQTVVVRDIAFASLCEHHLLPFHGRAHVGYVPNGRVVGLSKLARVVEAYARRPQLQERLTSQIADCIADALQPDGVAVVLQAEHLCVAVRGVEKPGSYVVTTATRGDFGAGTVSRAELLAQVRSA